MKRVFEEFRTEKHDAIVRWTKRYLQENGKKLVEYHGFPGSDEWQENTRRATEAMRLWKMKRDSIREEHKEQRKKWDFLLNMLDKASLSQVRTQPDPETRDVQILLEHPIGKSFESPDILVFSTVYRVFWEYEIIHTRRDLDDHIPFTCYSYQMPRKIDAFNYCQRLFRGRPTIIEIKSEIVSEGSLLRQVNKYKKILSQKDERDQDVDREPNVIVVSPDTGHRDFLESEGLTFWECPTGEQIIAMEKEGVLQ